ncbi:MAG TPA: hypothetical protein VFQ61_25545 [Polyangiaceae bacterium]|nr:hypothetical protein [Polyangiaceae bacterium]
MPPASQPDSSIRDRLTLLDDYVQSRDYPRNVCHLLGSLGRRLGFPEAPDEIGVVCPNVLEASEYLTHQYGAGPFFLGSGSPKDFTEAGVVKPYTTRIGFGYLRGVLIELAEPGLGSNLFGRALDPRGRITLHHLGFFARGASLCRKDIRGRRAHFDDRMLGAGYRPGVTTRLSALGLVGNVTIFETGPETHGIGTEFLDIRLFGRRGIPFGLPQWLLELGARFEIRSGHRLVHLPADHELPPAPKS